MGGICVLCTCRNRWVFFVALFIGENKEEGERMNKIGYGTSCLLVKDDSLYAGGEAPLFKWLREEGFVWDGGHGYFSNVNWVYINISSKVFVPGMPGVGITREICGHAITINEFRQIYCIFKKYEGLEPLRMSIEEQDAWHEKMRLEREKEKRYWENITWETYINDVECILKNVYTGIPAEEVPTILERYSEKIFQSYNSHIKPADVAESIFWDI